MDNQIKRIRDMESVLDESRAVIDRLSEAMDEYEDIQDRYYELLNYYSNGQWLRDFEDDEAGRLPHDLKRGVLSEDAVYDLITEYANIIYRMKKAVDRSEENNIK